MIILHMIGGLGNQLYQYALYLRLKELDKDVCIDICDYQPNAREPESRPLDILQIPGIADDFPVCTVRERETYRDDSRKFLSRVRRKIFGKKDHIYQEVVTAQSDLDIGIWDIEDAYLDGFWNNEGYFFDKWSTIRDHIQVEKLEGTASEENIACLRRMRQSYSIGIHIRRTDYTDESHSWRYSGICTDAYYLAGLRTAIQRNVNNQENKVFLFTDDVSYVKEQLNQNWLGLRELGEVTICDWNTGENSLYDILLMSNCKAMICANSTFSMWGARFCTDPDKVMIRPFRHDNTQKMSENFMLENWKNWILIREDGKVVKADKS